MILFDLMLVIRLSLGRVHTFYRIHTSRLVCENEEKCIQSSAAGVKECDDADKPTNIVTAGEGD